MEERDFIKLLKNNQYQVFFFTSPLPFPFIFLKHSWIVMNFKGKIERWDVWEWKNRGKNNLGHLSLNLYPPTLGTSIFYGRSSSPKKLRYNSKLIGIISGNRGSKTEKIMRRIRNNIKNYKFKDTFNMFPGPNCNTFTQWILNSFSKSNIRLSWTAIGKDYKNN